MTLYKCECGKYEKHFAKVTLKYIEGKFRASEAICECGKYMDSEPVEGMPEIKSTEASLSKKKRHDRLWKSAKEKLTGEKGINEPYK